MKQLLNRWMFCIFFSIPLLAYAQFPEGKYSGTLQFNPPLVMYGDTVKPVDMRLEIKKKNDSLYTWNTHYLRQNIPVEKNYMMRQINGIWYLDEQNGLLFPAEWDGHELSIIYRVDSNLYRAQYLFNADGTLSYLMRTYAPLETIHLEDAFDVHGYALPKKQFGILRKD